MPHRISIVLGYMVYIVRNIPQNEPHGIYLWVDLISVGYICQSVVGTYPYRT